MMRIAFNTVLCTLALTIFGCAGTGSSRHDAVQVQMERSLIEARLDILHEMAAGAHFDAYFACYTDDAIFLGTDAGERWTLAQFKDYARPHFSRGQGWTYTPRERHIDFAAPDIAYFDELLDNAKYGTCRGSGVLVRVPDAGGHDRWLVKQYNLAFMVPNEVAEQVAEISRKRAALEKEKLRRLFEEERGFQASLR